jgi:ankyrin repeat protein
VPSARCISSTRGFALRDARDDLGLLHCAAKSGRVDFVSASLDLGADVNMPSGDRVAEEDVPAYHQPGLVPLHYAVEAGHEKAVLLLLSGGAVASEADRCDLTLLHLVRTR